MVLHSLEIRTIQSAAVSPSVLDRSRWVPMYGVDEAARTEH